MAPEILKLEQYDQAVDVWTLGVLLYELFHNIEPFKGENPQMILNSILHSPLQFDKRCPKEARDLIKYVLNIDKNYRPKVGQMLNHQFFRDTPNQSTGMPQQGQGAYGQGQQQGGSFKFMAPVQNQPAPSVQAVGGYPGQFGNQGQQLGGIGQRVSAPVGSNPIVAANGNPSSTTNVPANAFQKQPAVQQINGVNSTPKTGLSPYGGALGFGYSTGNLPQAQAIQTGPRTVSTNQLTNLRGENNKAPDHYVPIMKANKDMTSPTNATGALQLGGNIQRPQQTPTQTQAQPGALRLNNQPGGTNLPPQYKQATNTFGQSPVAQAIVNAQQPTSFGQYPQQNQQNQQNQPNNGSIQIKSRPN